MADLTTLFAVKQYLAQTSTGADPLISSLIARESRAIERYTSRRFPFVQNAAKRLDGTGTGMLMLPDQPIIGIDALSIGGVEVPVATTEGGTGYLFDDTTIYLGAGQRFPMGRQNVVCSWRAGYRESVEALVPAGNTPTLWIQDPGTPAVVYAVTKESDGTPLALTANAPAAGEYQFNAPHLIFAAADAALAIVVDMAFIPGPVEQACIEMVGLDIKQRENLGVKSKTLAQETVSYEGAGMTPSVKEMLGPYRKVAPV